MWTPNKRVAMLVVDMHLRLECQEHMNRATLET